MSKEVLSPSALNSECASYTCFYIMNLSWILVMRHELTGLLIYLFIYLFIYLLTKQFCIEVAL